MYYKVVPVHGGMIGGHYAVEDSNGRLIGKELGLDSRRANILSNELHKAFSLGTKETLREGISVDTSPVEGQGSIHG